MKCLRDKFKQKVDFVKPLYKKVRNDNRVNVKPIKKLFVSVNVTNDTKLCGDGDGVYVKRKIIKDNFDCKNTFVVKDFSDSADRTLTGVNRNQRSLNKQSDLKFKPKRKAFSETFKHKNNNVKKTVDNKMERVEDNTKFIQAAKIPLADQIRDTWLRVYPAAQAHGECALSVIMRCLVCQIGLASFLVLWTVAFVFLIHYYEGPYETAVSEQFEVEQNQLVINLATELRQITPLSPKWKSAIERRIEDERKLTMVAIERGAKLQSGQFWNLSGTFLFTVYVMTALGFGAPVPQTVLGKTSGLIYAGLSVPTHIYLMVNASTCVVVYLERNLDKFKSCFRRKKHHIKSTDETGNPNSSRNSEFIKKPRLSILRRKITCLVNVLSSGRCVPFATVLYYAVGAICFGLVRGRELLDVFLFPLEFTTTGGLEHVEPHVRILYGVYIEGAMALLACALATLRRHSSATINVMSEKYRLFSMEPIS